MPTRHGTEPPQALSTAALFAVLLAELLFALAYRREVERVVVTAHLPVHLQPPGPQPVDVGDEGGGSRRRR